MKALEINVNDLEYNINKIKQRAGNSKIIAVVKGNAYGLGIKEYTGILIKNEIKDFAVSSVDEALELKRIRPECEVICMEASSVKEDLEVMLENDIIITIGDQIAANTLNEISKEKKKKANIQIKIDTGFSRYGFRYDQKELIANTIRENPSLIIRGAFSHFSCAYLNSFTFTKLQFERFLSVKEYLEENNIKIETYHIANSSAFLKYSSMYLDAVRIGSAFLGRISVENNIGLKRIGMLKSNIVSIKNIDKGTPIGYSNSEIAKRPTTLAIVPVGYSDGFNVEVKNDTFKFIDKLRIFKNSFMDFFKDNRIYVTIEKNKYPVIGKVGMNHIAVDITGALLKINDKVEMDVSPILVNNKIRRDYI